jgi:hypothetical protein
LGYVPVDVTPETGAGTSKLGELFYSASLSFFGKNSMTISTGSERRSGEDRRIGKGPLRSRLRFDGMRQSVRRMADRRRPVALDRYNPSLFVAIMIVLSLCLLDAMLTLMLIDRGAYELNPLMAYYLTDGPRVFLLVKYGLTALAVLLIVLADHTLPARYRMPVGILPIMGAFLGGVVIWELCLLSGW